MTTAPIPDLAPGTVVASRSWPADFGAWNRYAAVNDEFYAVHMEHEAARGAGMPGAFGMGNLQVAYANALLADWIDAATTAHPGTTGRITGISMSFRSPSLHGRVTAIATVSDVECDGTVTTVRLEVRTSDHDDRDLCTGTAVVVLDTCD